MPQRESYKEGTPNWVDLQTPDPEASKAFYAEIFGWTYDDQPAGDDVYSMAVKGGGVVGAIAPQQPGAVEQGVPPAWNTYFAVDDVDAAVERALEAGGQVAMGPMDVMDAGRMAVIFDPIGAAAALWQATGHIGATVVNEPGAFIWSELVTADPDAALPFYAAVLGLETEPTDMGEGTTYTMLKAGGDVIGGTTPPPMEGVPNHWHVWFAVEDATATAAAAAEAGGEVMHGPDVMSIGVVATIRDPHGAVFSVIQPSPPAEESGEDEAADEDS